MADTCYSSLAGGALLCLVLLSPPGGGDRREDPAVEQGPPRRSFLNPQLLPWRAARPTLELVRVSNPALCSASEALGMFVTGCSP